MTEFSTWPSAQDYIDAVQAPGVCFSDPRWRSAVFPSDSFGIPLFATGRSAVVFQTKVGSADVALRCFTRRVSNQKERYEKLSRYLKHGSPLGSFVPFVYQDHAILVGDKRYPMVEMTWSKGVPLNEWIAGRLKRSTEVAGLANAWRTVVGDLWERQIAHGDLANDNCLVSESGITLIDYDGCFIPTLQQSDPGEAGNVHFQHPGRLEGYYALNMDAFPSLVIYLSLLALSRQRSLWSFYMGDNLIFTSKDYLSPHKTPIWKELNRTGDPEVASLTGLLADMCAAPINSFPPLGELIARKPRQQLIPWVVEAVGQQSAQEVSAAGTAAPASDSTAKEWLEDWIIEPETLVTSALSMSATSAQEMPATLAQTRPVSVLPLPPPRTPARTARTVAVVALIVLIIIVIIVALS
jgi:hypothetical protein